MISYHKLITAFQTIGLRKEIPVIAHFGKDAVPKVNGGVSTLMGALLSSVDNVLLPAFTFSTMVTPESGPENNNIVYGERNEQNLDANIFSLNLSSECDNQEAIEVMKTFPGVFRSSHPVFSFYGLGLDIALLNHTPDQPYKPITEMKRLGGWMLLVDADPNQNFSIHLAEMLAGRKQFQRWALTPDGIAACLHFPGCPNGFHKLNYYLHDELRVIQVNNIKLSGIALNTLIDTAVALLREDPFALLCNDLSCERCNIVREDVKVQIANNWKPENRTG